MILYFSTGNVTLDLIIMSISLTLLRSRVLFGSLAQVFQPLADTFLNAVPKMKVTRYRIRRRLTTQYLLPIKNINTCKFCGGETMVHHLCVGCLKSVVVGKITEMGDELLGKPNVRPSWLSQRIKKAKGLNNSLQQYEQRNGKKRE